MKRYKLGVEVGAGDRYSSELLNRAAEFEAVQLIEPNAILHHDLASADKAENVSVGNFAISDFEGNDKFYNFGYCSFLHNADSFLTLSCEENAWKYWKLLSNLVQSKKMSSIDVGNIDYLILTCHGSEIFVLEDMISRPQIIRTKYYCHNAKHWEYYNKISKWMGENGYSGTVLETNQYQTFMHIEFKKQ